MDMVKVNFNRPSIDIFDPALNKGADAARKWDERYNRLDDQGQLSASEIRERIGSRPDVVSLKRPEQTGLFVNIEDRAIALEGIMAYLNRANRVSGGIRHTESGGTEMVRRYGDQVDEVIKGSERKRDELIGRFRAGISTLAATDALRANGIDDSQIELHRLAIQADINRTYGVGKAYADDRNRLVKKARRLADTVAGRKSRSSRRDTK